MEVQQSFGLTIWKKVWNVLQFSVVTRTNNFDMHVSSLITIMQST